MKIDVILPSLHQPLCERVLAQLREHDPALDVRVIVVAPFRPAGDEIEWVEELEPRGNCAANRAALARVRPDAVVIALCDDIVLPPDFLAAAAGAFRAIEIETENPKLLVGLRSAGGIGTCFGWSYANFPMFRPALLSDPSIDAHFYPDYLSAQWGDVALGMAVWCAGGVVKDAGPETTIRWGDRLGHPEAAHKGAGADLDMESFVATWGPVLGAGWSMARQRDFNVDRSPRDLVDGSIQPAAREPLSASGPGLWVLPSLNRVPQLLALIAQMRATGATQPGVVILGPEQQGDLETVQAALPRDWVAMIQRPEDEYLGAALNRFYADHSDLAWYGLISDDNWPVTPGWEDVLLGAAYCHGIASCDDGWQAPRRMHSAAIWRGDVLRAAGWWLPPVVRHSCADDWWEDVGRRTGRWRCIMEVLVEHRHPLRHGGALDATYQRQLSVLADDQHVYERWRRGPEAEAIIERIRACPSELLPDEQQRVARARSRKVMIATPVYRDVAARYMMSMVQTTILTMGLGITMGVRTVVGCSDLARARNELAAQFLASPCDDLIFIDADMNWEAADVIRLLGSEHDVIGAAGRKRGGAPITDPGSWCIRGFVIHDEKLVRDDDGSIEVLGVGTGFLKISRHALETIASAYPERKLNGNADWGSDIQGRYHRFFRWDDTQAQLGEDFLFCEDWRQAGGRVWVDPMIRLGHVGTHEAVGRLNDIMPRG